MKTLLYTLLFLALVSCEKAVVEHASPFDKVECGTFHIANDGTAPVKYVLAIDPVENVQPYQIYITSDTIIKIYERESYTIYFKDSLGASKSIRHETTTGAQSFIDSLPCTLWN